MSIESPNSRSSPWRRRPCQAFLALAVLVLLYAGYRGWQTYRHLSAFRSHLASLRASSPDSLESLGSTLAELEADVALLRNDLALPLVLAPHLGWLPVVGPTIEAGPVLFSAGESMLIAASTAWGIIEEPTVALVAASSNPEVSMAALSDAITAHASELEEVASSVRDSVTSVDSVEASGLLPRLAQPLHKVQSVLPLITVAFDLLPLLPRVIDQPDEQTFLLLAQNNDELRPTGGFISSIGVLALNRGIPRLGPLEDSYQAENWNKPHPDPPEPLRKYMGLDLWVTRDANWWPDFPTSAKAVGDLYELNQDRRVDGVLAIDVIAAARLLEALTPLELPDGQRMERGQVMEAFRRSWSLPPNALVTSGVVVTASQPFSGIEVALDYSKKGGQAWFDTVKVEDLKTPGVNVVRNPSFEEDADMDGLPDAWHATGFSEGDRLVAEQSHTGDLSLFIEGHLEASKVITQRLPISGGRGSSYRLSAESRSDQASLRGGVYALTITFLPTQGKGESVVAHFPALTHDWVTAGSDEIFGDWWRHRKDFIDQALRVAMPKVLSDASGVRWSELLTTARELLDQRHIQINVADAQIQELLRGYGWDGSMAKTPGDYVLLSDANVGYNKVSSNVTQSMRYEVVITDSGRASSRLSIMYENKSTIAVSECSLFQRYVPTYDVLTEGCYWDYVRVYVPLGARLRSSSGGDEPVVAFSELDRTVFATHLVLRPRERRELIFEYLLPPDVLGEDGYELYVQKQAGTDAIPLEVVIARSDGLEVEAGIERPDERDPSRLVYQTDLLLDRRFSVRFASPGG